MRALAVIACLAPSIVPAIAHAEPCEVDYVTVPDGIREVIEGWVAAEPNCRGTIALRVIPTKDGLFLFAERPDGTVHERLVPDLTAAGVLVASWVADPWRVEKPRRKKARAKKKRLEVRAVAVDEPTSVETTAMLPEPSLPRKRWISLGVTTVTGAEGADVGFRLETDVIVYGGWKLGVAVQKLQDTVFIDNGAEVQQGQIDDWAVGGILSRTMRWNGWEIRAGAGIYALSSRLHQEDFAYAGNTWTWAIDSSSAYELSLSLHRDLGDHWGLSLTGATMLVSQVWHGKENDLWYDRMDATVDRELAVVIASLRRRI